MKVAYFIGSLNRGGTETLVLDTFRKKELADYEPILIYRNEGDLSEAYRATGVPMFRIKPAGSTLGYIQSLRYLLKKECVDILHAQTLLNGLLGLFCTCGSKVKLISTFHGFFPSFKDRVFTHLVMWFARASVFVSEYERDWYVRRTLFAPKKRCYVVYNGIDFSKLDEPCEPPDFLKITCPEDKEIVKMAMVGNFVSGRSQGSLCIALKQLVDAGRSDFRFYFVGKRVAAEPYLYDDCVEYCRDAGLLDKQVFFLGGRGDVPAILQHVDIFVYSSHNDTFGIAVVEAMAAGLPVVVNDWVVMREITDNGKLAVIYKTEDGDDFVSKVSDVILNLKQNKIKAESSAASIRQRYGIATHIQHLDKLYSSVR